MDNSARRRLLKASAAAPFIYTLPNGALLAATSSTCKSTSTVNVQNNQDDTLTAADGTVYQKSGENYIDPDTGEVYYFNGQSALLSASCWNSIGATSQMRDFW